MGKQLPADWRIDALCLEADRRRMERGILGYSYGQLMKDTTEAQRESIYEKYLKERKRRPGREPEKLIESHISIYGGHRVGGGHKK